MMRIKKKHVTVKISQLSTENKIKEHEELEKVFVIEQNEIRNACRKLKNGKAGGKDGLKNERLKYMRQIATSALCTLFNSIIELEYIGLKNLRKAFLSLYQKVGEQTRPRKVIIRL